MTSRPLGHQHRAVERAPGRAPDWHRAATAAGDAVLVTAPQLLVFVGGLEYNAVLWGARDMPVVFSKPRQLVYAAHDYGGNWYEYGNCGYAPYAAALDRRWGWLLHEGVAPVWLSEFGTGHALGGASHRA